MTWAKLATAYGSAAGLDKAIAQLGSKSADVRAQALLKLESCIAHQGTIYSASAPAFAAILAHLVEPKTGDRPAIAKLLAKIAWGRGDAKSNAAVAAATKAAKDQLVALLGDGDAAVRTALATLIGKLCVLAKPVVDAVVARLAIEDDPAALLALASAPGIVGEATPAWQRACTAMLAVPERRLAGAAALVSGLKEKTPKPAVAVLVAALGEMPSLAPIWESSPWSNGKIAEDLPQLVAMIGPRRAAEVVPELLVAFDASGDLALARAALGLVIGKRKTGASKPTPAQREVLLRFLRSDAAWRAGIASVLNGCGVLGDRNELAILLGEPTTLLLDRAHGKQAIWELAKPWFKQKRTAAALLVELALSPVDAVRLLDELYASARGINVRYESALGLEAAWDAQVAALPRSAIAELAALIDEPGRDADSRGRLLGAFAAIGGTLDPARDRLIPVDYFDKRLHPHVPPARLEPLVYAALCAKARGLGEPETGHWGIGFARPGQNAARFLAVCPTKRLAQLILGLGGLSGIWTDCEEEVAKHLDHPVVATAFATFQTRVKGVKSYGVMRKKLADWVADTL